MVTNAIEYFKRCYIGRKIPGRWVIATTEMLSEVRQSFHSLLCMNNTVSLQYRCKYPCANAAQSIEGRTNIHKLFKHSTHCGPVPPYRLLHLSEHWLVAERHPSITLSKVDFIFTSGTPIPPFLVNIICIVEFEGCGVRMRFMWITGNSDIPHQ